MGRRQPVEDPAGILLNVSDLTRQGIELLKAGNREKSRQVLAAAILEDRDDLQAWLWLSGAVETDAERAACLQQVLRIDPLNAAALRGLAYLDKKRKGLAPLVPPEDGPTTPAKPVQISGVREAERTREVPSLSRQNEFRQKGAEEMTRPVKPSAASAEPESPPEPEEEEEERLVTRGRPSLLPAVFGAAAYILFFTLALVILAGHRLVILLVLVPAALVGLKTILDQFSRRIGTSYRLTTQRLLIQSGIFKTREHIIHLEQVARVNCQRSLLGRLIGTSDLLLYSDSGKLLARIHDMRDCQRWIKRIAQTTEFA